MVIEDDQQIQGIVEDALIDGGFEPAIAASGEEAVTLLKGNRGKYRALVTDISLLGNTDGWEVARQASSHIIMTKVGSSVTLSVPAHNPVAKGTLRSLVRASGLTVEEFVNVL